MFGLFKKDKKKELQKKYEKLTKQSFEMSKIDRSKSDALMAEADVILKEIEKLEKT